MADWSVVHERAPTLFTNLLAFDGRPHTHSVVPRDATVGDSVKDLVRSLLQHGQEGALELGVVGVGKLHDLRVASLLVGIRSRLME